MSDAAACTFCPTMMMLSRTSCKKVWLIQDTMITGLREARAPGKETRASAPKAYAHHIVPTALVTFSASQVLKRVTALLPFGMTSETMTGPCCLRRSIQGCRGGRRFGMQGRMPEAS